MCYIIYVVVAQKIRGLGEQKVDLTHLNIQKCRALTTQKDALDFSFSSLPDKKAHSNETRGFYIN
jgi:hypothetical protein